MDDKQKIVVEAVVENLKSNSNGNVFNKAKKIVQNAFTRIIKNGNSQNEFKILQEIIPNENLNTLLKNVKDNNSIPLELNPGNVQQKIHIVTKQTFSSLVLTFINFVSNNKIKLTIGSLILFLCILACFNPEFLTIIQSLISNKDYKLPTEVDKNNKLEEENLDQTNNVEEIAQDLNKQVEEKHKIFSENPTYQKFVSNNSFSPSTQNYLESLYTSLETLKEKENQLLILKEYNSIRTATSEEEKIEIKVHNKKFVNQLKIIKHNRHYYNQQINVILNSQEESKNNTKEL